jgi:hypothetical protein
MEAVNPHAELIRASVGNSLLEVPERRDTSVRDVPRPSGNPTLEVAAPSTKEIQGRNQLEKFSAMASPEKNSALGTENGAVEPLEGAIEQDPATALFSLRVNYPYIPIEQFPNNAVNFNLANAWEAADLSIPTGAVMASIVSDSAILISTNGRPSQPESVAGIVEANLRGATMLGANERRWFYVSGINQVQISAKNANTMVGVEFYMNT